MAGNLASIGGRMNEYKFVNETLKKTYLNTDREIAKEKKVSLCFINYTL
jgi:hypothetical protein